jgi:hypothetical protein
MCLGLFCCTSIDCVRGRRVSKCGIVASSTGAAHARPDLYEPHPAGASERTDSSRLHRTIPTAGSFRRPRRHQTVLWRRTRRGGSGDARLYDCRHRRLTARHACRRTGSASDSVRTRHREGTRRRRRRSGGPRAPYLADACPLRHPRAERLTRCRTARRRHPRAEVPRRDECPRLYTDRHYLGDRRGVAIREYQGPS